MTTPTRTPLVALAVVLSCFAAWGLEPTTAGNTYPIILVHGFAGWGRDELGGSKYWGGFHGDWQEDLKRRGYDVRTATIGPLSSNWDRACELYAQIKGGTVHYGANHAKRHGHNVTGRTFPGLYPQWGEVIDGQVQKIHLIGHSMGGQTARMLAQLLAEGTAGAPIPEDPSSHELFAGGKHWIHSITSIASPHQGTFIADGFDTFGDAAENLGALVIAGLHAFGGGVAKAFDVKLDQWGLAPKQPGESLSAYLHRAFQSKALRNAGEDLCVYSLSTAGARAENAWVRTRPEVFYYSISNQDTFRLGKVELPRPLSMFLPLQPLSIFMGSTYGIKRGYSSAWQANDGVVSQPSMVYDGKGSLYDGVKESLPGRWHHVGVLRTLDHEAVVGVKAFVSAFGLYEAQARLLYDLPAAAPIRAEGKHRRLRAEPDVHRHHEDVHRRVTEEIERINAQHSPEQDAAIACANPASDEIRVLCEEHFRRS